MPIIDPDQGVPLPAPADLANNPAAFTNFYTPVLSRQNNRYTNEANRTALHPANTNGEESFLTATGRKEINNGTLWRSSGVADCYGYVRRTTDAAVIPSTPGLTNDAVLFVSLTTGFTYVWESLAYYDSAAAADIVYAFTTPTFAAGNMRWTGTGLSTAAAAVEADVKIATQTVSGTGLSFGGVGLGTIVAVKMEGFIVATSTANLQLQYAQLVSTASNTGPSYRGGYLKVWKVA